MNEINVGLAGAGYWGSKLARNIAEARGSRLAAVAEANRERLASAIERHPGARAFSDLDALVADAEIDAIVIATPASVHADHTRKALSAGKHVLVEKPLALSAADCDELIALADERERTLMVGHTFIYSEPVRMLRRLIATGELGQTLYAYAQRLNLGVIREDLNALWNFGPHDVSILIHLLDTMPDRVSARQFPVLNRSLEDVAFLVLEFPGGVVGHIHESWLDPRKVRQLTVVGDRKMVVYDDTEVESPLRIYDKGVTPLPYGAEEASLLNTEGFGEFKLQVRAGDLLVPRVDAQEPLRVEIEHFAACALTGEPADTDGRHAREVVAVLEAADRSTAEGGRAVDIGEVLV
jgi:predicted dehydrogenase